MSQLIFELSRQGRRCVHLPNDDTPSFELPGELLSDDSVKLPEVAEIDLVAPWRGHSATTAYRPLRPGTW